MKRKLLICFATVLFCCLQKTIAQYANTTLSNLTPPTAVNVDLTPGTNFNGGRGYFNLGSPSQLWGSIYFRGFAFKGTTHIIQINNPNTYIGLGAGNEEYTSDVAFEQDNYNTAIGFMSLSGGHSTKSNTAVGANALQFCGYQANYNVAVGAWSLQNNNGSSNTAMGYFSLQQNTSGLDNTAIGYNALQQNTIGQENTAVGKNAMIFNSLGGGNSAFGTQALKSNERGFYNTAIGFWSMLNNYNGSHNVAVGDGSLNKNHSGQANTSIGTSALYYNTNGNNNVALGEESIYWNQTGSNNIGIGRGSLYNNNGESNTAIGTFSLSSNTTGSNNIAIGYRSINNNQTGSYNVGIGWAALYNNNENAYNVGIGLQAGYHSASRATFLGTYADAFDGAYNVTAIGYGAQVTSNNQVKIGNPEVTSIGGYANWTNFSDGRYKQNIKENVPGLEFINQLKPVTYTLDIDGIENALAQKSGSANNSSLSKIQASGTSGGEVNAVPARNQTPEDIKAKQQKAKVVYTGFVAQDVEKAAKAVNYDFSGVDVPKNKNDFYGLRYSDFVIPLVKAVQELSQKTDQIEALKKENEDLKSRLENLEKIVLGKTGSVNVSVSDIKFEQNRPNPFNNNTTISYFIPNRFTTAQLVISDNAGKGIKIINLTNASGNVNIDGSRLSSGSYQYSLIVDGTTIGTKKMVVVK